MKTYFKILMFHKYLIKFWNNITFIFIYCLFKVYSTNFIIKLNMFTWRSYILCACITNDLSQKKAENRESLHYNLSFYFKTNIVDNLLFYTCSMFNNTWLANCCSFQCFFLVYSAFKLITENFIMWFCIGYLQ